jgi:hypothetical protein
VRRILTPLFFSPFSKRKVTETDGHYEQENQEPNSKRQLIDVEQNAIPFQDITNVVVAHPSSSSSFATSSSSSSSTSSSEAILSSINASASPTSCAIPAKSALRQRTLLKRSVTFSPKDSVRLIPKRSVYDPNADKDILRNLVCISLYSAERMCLNLRIQCSGIPSKKKAAKIKRSVTFCSEDNVIVFRKRSVDDTDGDDDDQEDGDILGNVICISLHAAERMSLHMRMQRGAIDPQQAVKRKRSITFHHKDSVRLFRKSSDDDSTNEDLQEGSDILLDVVCISSYVAPRMCLCQRMNYGSVATTNSEVTTSTSNPVPAVNETQHVPRHRRSITFIHQDSVRLFRTPSDGANLGHEAAGAGADILEDVVCISAHAAQRMHLNERLRHYEDKFPFPM